MKWWSAAGNDLMSTRILISALTLTLQCQTGDRVVLYIHVTIFWFLCNFLNFHVELQILIKYALQRCIFLKENP